MWGLVFKRLLIAIPTLVVVSVFMFVVLAIGPNPLDQLRQNPNYTAEDLKRISDMYGWNLPPHTQYLRWASGFVQGDWGESIQTQRPAREMIVERLPLTLLLTGSSMVLSLLIAIPIGAYVAVRRYSNADYTATVLTFAMMATPSFFLGLLLQLMAVKLQDATGGTLIFFTGGPLESYSPVEIFRRLGLPILALSMLQVAGWSRYQRAELVAVLDSDYVRCAMAKGIPNRLVLIRHAMRNTMLPIISIVAIDAAQLFGGAVITETIFGLPGIGTLLLDSALAKDVVVVLDIVVIGAVLMILFNTLADILYGILDPRVRVS